MRTICSLGEKMNRIININKDWQFVKEMCEFDKLETAVKENVSIPHTWNGLDGQDGGNDYYRGKCWYLKEIDVEANVGGALYLDFEAANSVAEVYLNNTYLGKHEGGYSGFRFDITHQVVVGTNKIAVLVDNSHIEEIYPLFADFTFYGGIYRDVNLIYTNAVHFEKMDLASSGVYVSQVKITDDLAQINVKAKVVNLTNHSEVVLKIDWLNRENEVVVTEQSAKSIHSKGEFSVDVAIENPILWNGIENPYLYNCVVTLLVDGEMMDSLEIPTGLRYYTFDDQKGFSLNGKPMKLNGVSRHQDRIAVGNALTKAHQDEDMALIKEVGANSIRLAHYQHSQYFYDLCDQEGMVIWAEIPYISRTSKAENSEANAISQMRELIRQNYNHSSILMWGVQNEIGIMSEEKPLEQIVSEINVVALEEDQTRVTTQAQVMMVQPEDPANFVTDTVAFNKYYGWYVGAAEEFEDFIRDFRKENPNKSFGFSEYGAEGILKYHSEDPKVKDYSEEYHALYHETVMNICNKYDFVWGTYVWNMFDFGSDFRDEGGVQGRNNKGLVTFDRSTKKDAYFFYKSIWSKAPVLHINSKRFIERSNDVITVKVYSNLGLPKVFQNGQEVSLTSNTGTIYQYEAKLTQEDNQFEAILGVHSDRAQFIKVESPNMDYVLPESEAKKGISFDTGTNVTNWFEMNLNSEIREFTYPEGFYSIKNKISDIILNSDGEAVLRKYFGELFDHPMFEVVSQMPLKVLFSMQSDAFPEMIQLNVNDELTRIKIQ